MAEQKPTEPRSGRRWIADSFDGAVWIHDVDGDSVKLEAGDEIPAGHEAKVYPHIPQTDSKPRSARLRDVDAELAEEGHDPDEAPSFNPGAHSARDVVAYLEGNPEDVQRVLDLERSGQARKGILGRY